MGQKTHPTGFRLGIIKDWNSKWYAEKGKYADWLAEDIQIRKLVQKKVGNAGIAECQIRRSPKKVTVTLLTSRPGVVIGRKGKTVTVVESLPRNQSFLRDLSGELKRACGSGGKAGETHVEIQGDHRDKVRELLRAKGWIVKG